LPRNYIEDCAKTDEKRSVVNRNARIRNGRDIFGEEAIGDSGGDKEEQALAEERPEGERQSQEDETFGSRESVHGLAAVENPHGGKI
jgi:hypothetical protein